MVVHNSKGHDRNSCNIRNNHPPSPLTILIFYMFTSSLRSILRDYNPSASACFSWCKPVFAWGNFLDSFVLSTVRLPEAMAETNTQSQMKEYYGKRIQKYEDFLVSSCNFMDQESFSSEAEEALKLLHPEVRAK